MVHPLEKLEDVTFSIHYNPNCPSRYQIRLPGEGVGMLDNLPGNTTSDSLFHGKTLEKAVGEVVAHLEHKHRAANPA